MTQVTVYILSDHLCMFVCLFDDLLHLLVTVRVTMCPAVMVRAKNKAMLLNHHQQREHRTGQNIVYTIYCTQNMYRIQCTECIDREVVIQNRTEHTSREIGSYSKQAKQADRLMTQNRRMKLSYYKSCTKCYQSYSSLLSLIIIVYFLNS